MSFHSFLGLIVVGALSRIPTVTAKCIKGVDGKKICYNKMPATATAVISFTGGVIFSLFVLLSLLVLRHNRLRADIERGAKRDSNMEQRDGSGSPSTMVESQYELPDSGKLPMPPFPDPGFNYEGGSEGVSNANPKAAGPAPVTPGANPWTPGLKAGAHSIEDSGSKSAVESGHGSHKPPSLRRKFSDSTLYLA